MSDDPFVLSQRFPAAPNYLIQIYLFEREGDPVVGTRIGERLGVSPSAVTQSLGRLVERELVGHDAVRGFSLTKRGRRLAERIVSRHYLLERLLVDELGVAWDVADEEAELLQSSLTSRLEEILTERLKNPQTCPHGNPFPGSRAERHLLDAPSLMSVPVGSTVRLIRITEEGEMVEGLLHFCVEHAFSIGTAMTVESRSDDVQHIRAEETAVTIPNAFARHMRVEA